MSSTIMFKIIKNNHKFYETFSITLIIWQLFQISYTINTLFYKIKYYKGYHFYYLIII